MKTRNIAASCLTVALGLLGTGTATADTTDAPVLSHQAEQGDSTTATVDVTSSDALAGESLTVLIMNDDADAADPATEDVVFIEQYELDDGGATDFAVQLPTDVLEDYDIALNTAAGTDRYLAPLVGDAESDPGDEPTPPDDGDPTVPEDNQGDGADGEQDSGTDDETTRPGDGDPTGPEGNQGDGGAGGQDSGTDDESPSDGQIGSDIGGSGDSNAVAGSDAAGDASSNGFLANTGANITFGIAIALAAIALGTWLVLRRRKTYISR